MSDQDIINEATDLNSLAEGPGQGRNGSPLYDLWLRCPGIVDQLPFMLTDEKTQAANAYVYSAGSWLDRAEKIYPQVLPLDSSTAADLAGNIVTVKGHLEFLKRLGYTGSLDGVSGSAADLVRKFRENLPSGTGLALGAGAIAVIAILVLVIVLR